jgi:hypothetical protein
MPTTTEKLIAYHGNPLIKEQTMAKIAAHRAADRIAKGAYVRKNGTTTYCAVGCLLEDPDGGHLRYESKFGVPAQLAYLEDGIFESLPDELAIPWPERFMGAIPVGADLSTVWPGFAVWLMTDEEWGMRNVTEDEEVKAICGRVAEGYQRDIDGDPLRDADLEALSWAARDARDAWAVRAAWDAWAVRDARAAWAARAARDAWAVRAVRAAWAARDAWDAWAARAAWDAWAVRAVRAAWAARDARDAWAVRAAFAIASADKLTDLLTAA